MAPVEGDSDYLTRQGRAEGSPDLLVLCPMLDGRSQNACLHVARSMRLHARARTITRRVYGRLLAVFRRGQPGHFRLQQAGRVG
jgi:hypothetical protein